MVDPPPGRCVFQLLRCSIFPVRIPPNGVISFKSDGADNFCIVEVEDELSAAMGWMSLLGLNTLSAEVLSTPIFRVLALKPLLKRANLEGVDVTVLCLDNFLFLDVDSFDVSLVFELFDEDVVLDEWLLDCLEELGGSEPDLF